MKKTFLIITLFIASINANAFETIEVKSTGQGLPIIIISGFGGADIWNKTLEELSLTNKCFFVTINGVNGKEISTKLSVENVINDIVSLIHSSEIDKPVLLGHSFGGFIAMQMAANYSSLIGKLIILDSYPFALALLNPSVSESIGQQQSTVYRNYVMSLSEEDYLEFWRQNSKEMATTEDAQLKIYQSISQSPRSTIIEAQCLMFSNDLRSSLFTVSCPTLVIGSIYSYKKTGVDATLLETRINEQFINVSNSKVIIHKTARHFIMLDDQTWLVNQIKQFI